MGKYLRKLWAFVGLLILLPFSPQALLAKQGDGETTGTGTVAADSPAAKQPKTLIPVVLSADSNYGPQMYITMLSMLQSAHGDTFYHLHLFIPSNFEQKYKDEIAKFVNKYECKITFINMGTAFSDLAPELGSPAAHYRLLIADSLKNYVKCIYMDVDILVRHDLVELYNTDLGDCYIGGVKDAGIFSKCAWIPGATNYVVFDLGLHQYVNSGVILMNLDLIRRDGLTGKLVSTIKHGIDGTKPFLFPDQDALNKVCCGGIKILDIKYNFFSIIPLMNRRSQKFQENMWDLVGKEQFEEACRDPWIVHFAGTKPWLHQFLPYAEEWWACARETPFYEEIMSKATRKTSPASESAPKASSAQ
ncbi:MAG: glycosyltransferase family 8 protein [Puniceicoccales bacterium]|jgi:lipopolysaccharide biosynthesis glycosyltransferase|nr:glycosyltransferase family 8 protein [Puniceicoccales bacterium]